MERKRDTNLNLGEDRQENVTNVTPNTPWDDEQERVDSVKTARFNDDGEGGLIPPADLGRGTRGGSNVPTVHQESCEDYQGENGVESGRKREIWEADCGRKHAPDTVRLGSLVDKPETHRYTRALAKDKRERRRVRHGPKEARNKRKGKATT